MKFVDYLHFVLLIPGLQITDCFSNYKCDNDTSTSEAEFLTFQWLHIQKDENCLRLNIPSKEWKSERYNLSSQPSLGSYKLHVEVDQVKVLLISEVNSMKPGVCNAIEKTYKLTDSKMIHIDLHCNGYFDIVVKLLNYKENGDHACHIQVNNKNSSCQCPVRRYCNIFNGVGEPCSVFNRSKPCRTPGGDFDETPYFLLIAIGGVLICVACMSSFMIYMKFSKRRMAATRENASLKCSHNCEVDLHDLCKLPLDSMTYQEYLANEKPNDEDFFSSESNSGDFAKFKTSSDIFA